MKYRSDLQGLRALAVGLVVFSHFGFFGLEGGYLGVDIFFVLSGFLITQLLVKELDEAGNINLGRFYARRIRRLFPAMLVMVLSIFVFAVLWLPGAGLKAGLAAAPYALTWTSNLFFDFRELGYFERLEGADFFLHTWSLAVEEQFYLIWPLVLMLLFNHRVSPQLPSGRGCRAASMALVGAAGFFFCLALQSATIDSAFYQMPARIWEFAVGACCGLLLHDRSGGDSPATSHLTSTVSAVLSGTGIGFIVASAYLVDEATPHPGLATLWPVAGTAFLILGGAGSNWFSRLLASKPLVWIGDRSYSIYLWHWPMLLLAQAFIVGAATHVGLVALLLTLLLSMLSYSLVEYPFWKGRFSRSPGRMVLSSSLSAAIPGVVLTGAVLINLNNVSQEKPDVLLSARFDIPSLYARGCDDWYKSSDVVPCAFGDPDAKRTAVYMGDSIGMQWFSAVEEAFVDDGWFVTLFTKSACPMVDSPIYYDRLKRVYRVCEQWRSAVLEEVRKLAPDLVIVGSSSNYEYTDDEWVDGSRAIFSQLEVSADTVLVLPGTPRLPFHGPACVQQELAKWGELPAGNCSSRAGLAKAKRVETFLRQAASGFQNVSVIEVMDLVCPGGTCRAMNEEGLMIYRDRSHLADGFVQEIASVLGARMKEELVTE